MTRAQQFNKGDRFKQTRPTGFGQARTVVLADPPLIKPTIGPERDAAIDWKNKHSPIDMELLQAAPPFGDAGIVVTDLSNYSMLRQEWLIETGDRRTVTLFPGGAVWVHHGETWMRRSLRGERLIRALSEVADVKD